MSDEGTLYVPSPSLRRAEEELSDFTSNLGPPHGLAVTMRRLPRCESNTAEFMICITPRLDKPFNAVALERTYAWLARAWNLPPGLPGTNFLHEGDGPFELLGASLLVPRPGYFFVAAKANSDGNIITFSRNFLERNIIAPLEEESRRDALRFIVGFGANETAFDLT